ncbi:MAG: hypothetical protein NVSMB16_06280 [Acidimicrobiales bacterium]
MPNHPMTRARTIRYTALSVGGAWVALTVASMGGAAASDTSAVTNATLPTPSVSSVPVPVPAVPLPTVPLPTVPLPTVPLPALPPTPVPSPVPVPTGPGGPPPLTAPDVQASGAAAATPATPPQSDPTGPAGGSFLGGGSGPAFAPFADPGDPLITGLGDPIITGALSQVPGELLPLPVLRHRVGASAAAIARHRAVGVSLGIVALAAVLIVAVSLGLVPFAAADALSPAVLRRRLSLR